MAASRSLDSSTHAGSVIVRPDNTLVSTGYNNPIRGMNIDEVPTTRPEKYFYMEHAERNAIFSAAKNEGGLAGCRLYINFLPCADCARAIVQAGITEVVVHTEGHEAFIKSTGQSGDWEDSYTATLKIFKLPDNKNMIRWWSGKLWQPTGFFRGKVYNL